MTITITLAGIASFLGWVVLGVIGLIIALLVYMPAGFFAIDEDRMFCDEVNCHFSPRLSWYKSFWVMLIHMSLHYRWKHKKGLWV